MTYFFPISFTMLLEVEYHIMKKNDHASLEASNFLCEFSSGVGIRYGIHDLQ